MDYCQERIVSISSFGVPVYIGQDVQSGYDAP